MPVQGLGVDIIQVSRIEEAITRYGNRFLNRVFTPEEQQFCENVARSKQRYQRYAALWACKEAVMKALGTGARRGVYFRVIEILHKPTGEPMVNLSEGALEQLVELGCNKVMVSMSHDGDVVAAAALVMYQD
ncbi:holo-[acyl-carrier-protein] synthase [Candidatus Woesearchaeota archaeon]|nr:holo-ACP synthase [Candidatus Woesearchaeota archaeon]RLE42283.1 MAG: holo-[acyl-carrier-protein] synthase [Candidatus Woesearchaeota archaeon]